MGLNEFQPGPGEGLMMELLPGLLSAAIFVRAYGCWLCASLSDFLLDLSPERSLPSVPPPALQNENEGHNCDLGTARPESSLVLSLLQSPRLILPSLLVASDVPAGTTCYFDSLCMMPSFAKGTHLLTLETEFFSCIKPQADC